jgi:hypothetical protein
MHTTWTRRQHDTGVHYLHRVETPQFCCTHMKSAWEDRAIGVRFGGEQIEILGQHALPFEPHPISFCPFCAAPIITQIQEESI